MSAQAIAMPERLSLLGEALMQVRSMVEDGLISQDAADSLSAEMVEIWINANRRKNGT